MEDVKVEPAIRDSAGRFVPGVSGNPSGRPKGTMKDYLRRKFTELSDEEKERFLIENKVPGLDQIKLAEGNPHQSSDTLVEIKPSPLLDALRNNDRNKEDSGSDQTD
jgi:hypothetical protein